MITFIGCTMLTGWAVILIQLFTYWMSLKPKYLEKDLKKEVLPQLVFGLTLLFLGTVGVAIQMNLV